MGEYVIPAGAKVVAAPVGRRYKRLSASAGAGEINITTVAPKTAAMLMAIVADKLKAPLNELRFVSIREVK